MDAVSAAAAERALELVADTGWHAEGLDEEPHERFMIACGRAARTVHRRSTARQLADAIQKVARDSKRDRLALLIPNGEAK